MAICAVLSAMSFLTFTATEIVYAVANHTHGCVAFGVVYCLQFLVRKQVGAVVFNAEFFRHCAYCGKFVAAKDCDCAALRLQPLDCRPRRRPFSFGKAYPRRKHAVFENV